MRISILLIVLCLASTVATSQTVVVNVTGNMGESGSQFAEDYDGNNHTYGYNQSSPPANFTIRFWDTSGTSMGRQWRIRRLSGPYNSTAGSTLGGDLGFGPRGATTTTNVPFRDLLYSAHLDSWSGYNPVSGAADYGQTASGSVTADLVLELVSGATVEDSFSFSLVVSYSVTVVAGFDQPVYNWPSGMIVTLYDDGELPPEGRETEGLDETPVYNTNVAGAVGNESGEDQTLTLWADVDGLIPIGTVIAPDGVTTPFDFGYDLPAGTDAFWTASGYLDGTGGNPGDPSFVPFGSDFDDYDLNFPAQESFPTTLVTENLSGDPAAISVGGDIPQETFNPPPGLNEYERAILGLGGEGPRINGGTEEYRQTDPSGNTTVVVSVPGSGGSATVNGTATVATGGGSTTVTTITTSGGSTLTVGDPPQNPTPPQNPGSGGGVPTTVNSSTSSSENEVAAILSEIRAEMAAAAVGAGPVPGPSASEIDGKGSDFEVVASGVVTAGDLAIEGLGDGESSFLGLQPDIEPASLGDKGSYTFTILGESKTLVFDQPMIPFFRALLLTFCLLFWYFWLFKFSRV